MESQGRLDILTSLPVQLSHQNDAAGDVFKKASQALVRLVKNLMFIRWQLVSKTLDHTDAFDFSGCKLMSTQLSAVPHQETCIHQVICAVRDVTRDEDPQACFHLSNSPQPGLPSDLQLLQQSFGARSCLVAPITLGCEVLGALCVASPSDDAFQSRDMEDVRAVIAMVAPHAAILRRSIKSCVSRTVLNTMLPLRVLELIDHRLGRQTVQHF